MPRPFWITVCVVGAWLGSVCTRPAAAAEDFSFYHENVMGTALELRVRAEHAEAARWAEDRVLREIDRLSSIFSGYDKNSELSCWQAAARGPVKVSPELFEVLQACERWQAKSSGAFDPRVQVLTQLWTRCAEADRLPTAEALAGARARMAGPAWRLDPRARTAERLTDCPISLNAIAKGYIIERACQAALDQPRGVRGLLLNVGGDLRVCGDAPRTVGVAPPWADSESAEPFAYVRVQDRAVATSGNSQRGFSIGGHWYSHIFDPRSGMPVEGIASATVIAERSLDADALATIFNVLPAEESARLANSLPGVECLIVTTDGRIARSQGWHRHETSPPSPPTAAPVSAPASSHLALADSPDATAKAWWGDEFELAVNFEISRPDGEDRRYRRPYVAVWVEDKDGFPVRNLTLWVSLGGSGPFQWLPDLKRWYRSDQARKKVDKTELVFTMARPTRPPGKYRVVWNGKDDHGKPLAPGEYTILIDTAREHGTYQSLRKQVTIADKPFTEELKGNVEIRSATLEYRRKDPAK